MATIKTLLCSFLVLVSFIKIHFIKFTFPKSTYHTNGAKARWYSLEIILLI